MAGHSSNNPTPAEIQKAREAAGLSRPQAAELVHRTARYWQLLEAGKRPVDLAVWELFLLKSAK